MKQYFAEPPKLYLEQEMREGEIQAFAGGLCGIFTSRSPNKQTPNEDAAGSSMELRNAILNGIERANQRISAMGVGAATTLAVVEIQGRTVRPYHVGDSMIMVVGQRGKIKL